MASPSTEHRGTATRGASAIVNAMSVDVEDYFQVSAFSTIVDRRDWDSHECRVERNVDRLLALFEARNVHATFFTLGWVAERYPETVRRIVAGGHELASHGLEHVQVFRQQPDAFRADIRRTKELLEDISGTAVNGYRAASFSIDERTPWAFDVLAEEGHLYSSSIYPVRHDLYGIPDAPRFPYRPSEQAAITELPITTARVMGRNVPSGGGGYFRLMPYAVSRWLLRRVNHEDGKPCIFYCHPWEFDPSQPRFPRIPLKTRIRHYLNLDRTEARLDRLLRDFAWDRVDRAFGIGTGAAA
jgi:polysaccharide deacetylase family protein (PEP-CTERM system associated)